MHQQDLGVCVVTQSCLSLGATVCFVFFRPHLMGKSDRNSEPNGINFKNRDFILVQVLDGQTI